METVAQTEALFQGRMPAGAVNAAHAYRVSGFSMPTDAR
jgi:D-3-phosphoglycerate dehydrogenase